ncbi:MAG: hypothetical protein JOZ58_01135 [Acetobacteraceae bacterium]|nr:hypothetical protein [Acetobacteraceae bacterium]MBV8573631.1 hypothetical protein [Acetobacteraceae bacterium]
MNATIVEEKGTHLLMRRGDRFAIIERRNNRLYNCHGGKRDGIAADDLSALAEIVDEADWVDEAVAWQAFNEAGSRGTDLAERMR